MSSNDDSPDIGTLRFTGSLRITHLRKDKHTYLLPFSDTTAALIGQIVAYWGVLELRMDGFTGHVSQLMSVSLLEQWQRQPFKKRRVLFRDTMRQYTQALFPALTIQFDTIASMSADLHWQRNILTHGNYVMLPGTRDGTTGVYSPKFRAVGFVNGRERSIDLEEDTLSRLWHEIAHLIGDLMVLLNQMGGSGNTVDVVIPDIDLLQSHPSGSFRILATPNK